jgi:WD40 repeat protein
MKSAKVMSQALRTCAYGALLAWIPLSGAALAQDAAMVPPRLVVQTSHTSMVTDFVYNQEASLLATLGADGVAKIWNAGSGKELHTLAGFSFRGIAIHPYDDLFAGVESNGVIQLFDGVSGEEKLQLAPPNSKKKDDDGAFSFFNQPMPIAFSSDGKLLVSASRDGVQVWDVERGELHKDLGKKSRTRVLALSPDGNTVAIETERNIVRLFSTANGKKLRDIPAKVGEITALTFSPDSSAFAVGSQNGSIRVFDRASGKEIGKPPVYNICDRPYEVSAATGGMFKGLGSIAKVVGGDAVRDAISIGEQVTDVTESAGQWCGTTQMVTDAFSGDYMRMFTRSIRSMAVGSGGTKLAYQTGDNTIRVMDMLNSEALYEIDPSGEFKLWGGEQPTEEAQKNSQQMAAFFFMFAPIKFSSDGATFNTIGQFKTVARWDADTGERVNSLAVSSRDLSMGMPMPIPGGSVPVFGSDGRSLLTATLTSGTKLWHLDGNKPPELVSAIPALFNKPAISPDARLAVSGEVSPEDGTFAIVVREFGSEKVVQRFEDASANQSPAAMLDFLATFSPDSKRVVLQTQVGNEILLRVFDLQSADELYRTKKVVHATFSADGELLSLRESGGKLRIVETTAWDEVFKAKAREAQSGMFAGKPVFSADSKWIAMVDDDRIRVWEVKTGKARHERSVDGVDVSNLVFAPDREVLTYTTKRTLFHWNLADDELITSSMSTDFWGNLSYSPDGRLLALGGAENRVRLFDVREDVEIGSLVVPSQDDWLVITPDGRLDTRWLEDVNEVHWVVRDEPFSSQPLELFMREYYEPQLLSRLVRGETLPPIPDLAGRNRALPIVEITEVTEKDDNRLHVKVKVVETSNGAQRDATGSPLRSGAYGLRLLRDGRLVGHAPQDFGQLTLDASGQATVTFDIQVPAGTSDGTVELSAYAFNSDNVKSVTTRYTHELQDNSRAGDARAYLVSIGVNASDNPSFALRYAANDARLVQDALSSELRRLGRYADIVNVPLISDDQSLDATTGKIKAVFDILAGRDPDLSAGVLQQIPGVDRLSAARPDDLVLITFAGHGYTEANGVFYFVPSDIGSDSDGTLTSIRDRLISSDMVSEWMLGIDAGELIMVVDACYSAAVVEGQDFKPGPLGSRGLGQLSYDKGMRILTATQANDVALELDELEHGMLTYALVVDGISRRHADFRPVDSQVMSSEWLRYAVDRVPELYTEARRGDIKPLENGQPVSQDRGLVLFKQATASRQQPAVFDFSRRTEGELLVTFD